MTDEADVPPDQVADVFADALDAIGAAIAQEDAEGRPPRTALAYARLVADVRPQLLARPRSSTPAPAPPPPGPEPHWSDHLYAELTAKPTYLP